MKQVALRLPDDLHIELVALAKRDKRSLHSEILWLLERGIEELADARALEEARAEPGLRSYDEVRQELGL
jgi:predicted DNA-binding protein